MPSVIYNRGLDRLHDFQTASAGTYKWLLLKGSGYIPDADHDFVADLTPASNEVAGAGYSRQSVSSPTRTVDDGGDRVVYDADDPSFGSIATGSSVTGMVLYHFVTNDSDSELVVYLQLPIRSTDGSTFAVPLNVDGILYINQA